MSNPNPDQNPRLKRLGALERHINRLDRRLEALGSRDETLTRWRLLVFLGGLLAVLAGLAFNNWLGLVMMPVWLAGFSALVHHHRRIQAARDQTRTWRIIKRGHLARMRLDWANLPPESVQTPNNHPFAADLDITGTYSIHRLLDTPVSQRGSSRLKDWLLSQHPDCETIQRRQGLVQALIPARAFRDRLTLNAMQTAGGPRKKWDGDALLAWLQASPKRFQVPMPVFALLISLSALNILLLVLSSAGIITPTLWGTGMVVYGVISARYWRKLSGLFVEALAIQHQIRRLRAVFRHLETHPYAGREPLRALCAPLLDTAKRPSTQLRKISVITTATSLQHNVILWLALNLLVPWDILWAYLLFHSKGSLAAALPGWLDAWYELEALSALATFADLNPQYTFPTVKQPPTYTPESTLFTGRRLGHPLIPAETRISNDFEVKTLGQVVMITGSNMAGKSSFLRTLGVNLVLAYAGSVTAAAELRAGLFRVFTCIRVTDSVVDGISYFYAEVKRLKALLNALEMPGAPPLFYLIDEIFRGTNNRERLIGSRSYIRALAGKNGFGFIATHDLELVKLADHIAAIQNYHFREDIVHNRMVFDYVLRPGPSPTTNALKIMRLEGLPVEAGDIEHAD